MLLRKPSKGYEMEIFNAISKHSTAEAIKKPEAIEPRKPVEAIAKNTVEKNAKDKEEIKQQLNKAVEEVNDKMKSLETNVSFGFNDKIESMYVDVTEKHTGQVIRKIPSEEFMKLTEHFREIIGIIFDRRS